MVLRRELLKAGAFGAMLPGGLSLMSAASRAQSNQPADGFDRLEALVKMRGSTDGRTGFAWIKGTRYAQVGGKLEPMCGLLNCTISRYRRLSDDAFDLRLYETSFYTNPETGVYQPELKMPFTGKMVDVPLYRTGPGHHVVKTSNSEEMSWGKENTTSEEAAEKLAPRGRILYDVALSDPLRQGNNVWLTTTATTLLEPSDPNEKPWSYKELITNTALANELSDPARTWVDSTSSYTLVMDWRPWMKMDGVEGRTVDHAGQHSGSFAAPSPGYRRCPVSVARALICASALGQAQRINDSGITDAGNDSSVRLAYRNFETVLHSQYERFARSSNVRDRIRRNEERPMHAHAISH